MEQCTPAETHQKLSRYWSERREKEIVARVSYRVHDEDGCRIYEFRSIDEIGS